MKKTGRKGVRSQYRDPYRIWYIGPCYRHPIHIIIPNFVKIFPKLWFFLVKNLPCCTCQAQVVPRGSQESTTLYTQPLNLPICWHFNKKFNWSPLQKIMLLNGSCSNVDFIKLKNLHWSKSFFWIVIISHNGSL